MKVARSEVCREGVLEVEDVVLGEEEVDTAVYISAFAFGRW